VNDAVLGVALPLFGTYFLLLMIRDGWTYLRFLRRLPSALLTWRTPRPAHMPLLVGLGCVSAAAAALNARLERPLLHVVSQAFIALYFVLMVPLLAQIRLGFYQEGIWAVGGFLAYGDIARLAFRETPEIVLVLLQRGHGRSFRLPVPPDEYGAVRKVLEDRIRARAVNVEAGLLGL
jgi:hypothetical protein